jgi:hypothetical protein
MSGLDIIPCAGIRGNGLIIKAPNNSQEVLGHQPIPLLSRSRQERTMTADDVTNGL